MAVFGGRRWLVCYKVAVVECGSLAVCTADDGDGDVVTQRMVAEALRKCDAAELERG